jgi:hypothetical protein
MDHHHHHSPLVHEYDTHPDFTKRPISPPLSSGEISDSHRHHSHPQAHGHAPVSLLSALMHSPPSTGLLSPHSSAPSTAVSSPHLRPVTAQSNGMGGLEVPAMSILRRDSFSSDGEALAGIAGQDDKAPRPQVQPQQQADGCEVSLTLILSIVLLFVYELPLMTLDGKEGFFTEIRGRAPIQASSLFSTEWRSNPPCHSCQIRYLARPFRQSTRGITHIRPHGDRRRD